MFNTKSRQIGKISSTHDYTVSVKQTSNEPIYIDPYVRAPFSKNLKRKECPV